MPRRLLDGIPNRVAAAVEITPRRSGLLIPWSSWWLGDHDTFQATKIPTACMGLAAVREEIMDAPLLRRALALFLGDERYRKFVKHLHGGPRMRFWQEKAWSLFVSASPEWAISEKELRRALSICWVHGLDLVPETLLVVKEVTDYRGFSVRTCSDVYPYAESTALLWTVGCPFPPSIRVVWYCPECRSAYAAAHPAQRRSLDWDRIADLI